MENLTRLCQKIEESPDGPEAFECRSAILSEELNIAYYDLGEDAVGRLYRSNMKPRLVQKPSRGMIALWGRGADQVLALVTDLERDYKFKFDERIRKALGL